MRDYHGALTLCCVSKAIKKWYEKKKNLEDRKKIKSKKKEGKGTMIMTNGIG